MNFVEEEEAGLHCKEGTDPTRTTPQFSKKHAIRKKMLDLIRPPVAVCGPNMSNFHSPFPSTATPLGDLVYLYMYDF